MTLRARIAGAAGLAVAVAVLVAAVSLYVAVRSELRGEVDRSLTQRAIAFTPTAPSTGGGTGGGGSGGGGQPRGFRDGSRPDGAQPIPDGGPGGFPDSVQPVPLGGASGYVQFISPTGTVHVPGGQGPPASLPASALDRTIARRGTGLALSDRTVKGTHLRLGLAIVRQAAEAHGGRVEARNAPGGGALVRASFGAPVAPTPPASSRGGDPDQPVLR